MVKKIATLVFAFVFAPQVLHAAQLYQNNNGTDDIIRWGNTDVQMNCQPFTTSPSETWTVEDVSVKLLYNQTTPPTGTITIGLWEFFEGTQGTVLGSGTFDASEITTTIDSFNVVLDSPVTLELDSDYCVRYSTSNLVDSGTTQIHTQGSAASNPDVWYYNGAWGEGDSGQGSITLNGTTGTEPEPPTPTSTQLSTEWTGSMLLGMGLGLFLLFGIVGYRSLV